MLSDEDGRALRKTVARAGRFRAEGHALEQFLHEQRRDDVWSAVLCGGYEFAFSGGWGAVGSALCGELYRTAWAEHVAPAVDRFDHAVTALVIGFRARAKELYQPDDDHDVGSAAATFLAILDDGVALHARWLGDQTALVIRDGAIVWETRGHSLRNAFLDAGHDITGVTVPSVVTRMIATDADRSGDVPDRATFTDRRPGDRLVIAGHELHDHLTRDEIVDAIASADPEVAAQTLVELVATRGNPFGVVICIADL